MRTHSRECLLRNVQDVTDQAIEIVRAQFVSGHRRPWRKLLRIGEMALDPFASAMITDAVERRSSLHPDSDVTLDWNQLYYRELNIVTSYSASPADLEEALKLLANGSVRVAPMTGHTFPLERFSEALAAIESRAILKAIMTPGEI